MDTFGRADPFLVIYRATEDGRWVAVAKTEYLKRTYNPDWKPMLLKVQQLCNGDYHRPLLFRCFDWNRDAAPDFMGECEASLDQIMRGELRELTFRRKGTRKTYGTLFIVKKKLRQKHSFLEFISAGMEIQLMVAIDFTASNGDPRDRNSLHFQGTDQYGRAVDNAYLEAIKRVGSVLEPYDSDNQIPVWGFGAKIQGEGQARHCFNLTLNDHQQEVNGIQGIINAYVQALPRVTLSGPTLFSQVLETAMALSATPYTHDSQAYTVLLIITDGVINDKQATTDRIVTASDMPISVIIVGVGNADFSTMEYLDADDVPLRHSNGQMMKRDIVQFVPYNEFRNAHPTLFTKEVLEELPDQITSYMAQKGHHPIGWQTRVEDEERMRVYNQAGEGQPGQVLFLDPERKPTDPLLAGLSTQNRPYFNNAGGKRNGVNTGHEDDYLYQGGGGGCCIIL